MTKTVTTTPDTPPFHNMKTIHSPKDFKKHNKVVRNPDRFRVFSNFLKTKVFNKTPLYIPISFNHIIQILNKEMGLARYLHKNPSEFVGFHQWLDNFLRSKNHQYLMNRSHNFELLKIPYDPSLMQDSSSPISEPPVSPLSSNQEDIQFTEPPLTESLTPPLTESLTPPLAESQPSINESQRPDILEEAKTAEECGLLCEFFLRLTNSDRIFLLRNYFQHDVTRLTSEVEMAFKILYTQNIDAVLPDYLFENDFVFLTFLNQYCLIPK